MKNLKNIVLMLATLICMPLVSMQAPPQQEWILTIPLAENTTPEQRIQRVNEVAHALGGNQLADWTYMQMFNEIWAAIRETRPRIVELLHGQPWFQEDTLTPAVQYRAPEPPRERPQIDVNR